MQMTDADDGRHEAAVERKNSFLSDNSLEDVEQVSILAYPRHGHHGAGAVQRVGHGLTRYSSHRPGNEVEVGGTLDPRTVGK